MVFVKTNDVYTALIERLRYPNPKSEYLLRILKKLVTPEDIKLILELPAEPIELARKLGLDEKVVNGKLNQLLAKGVVVPTSKGPQLARELSQLHDVSLASSEQFVDSEYLDLWKQFYEAEWRESLAEIFGSFEKQALRVLPARKALERSPGVSSSDILPEEDIRELIKKGESIALVPCSCRRSMKACTSPVDVCLQFNKWAEFQVNRGAGRRVSVEEAIAAADQSEEAGLVHTQSTLSPGLAIICNCCCDCCIILDPLHTNGKWSNMLIKSRYEANVDDNLCTGCQDCVERCCFDAIEMNKVQGTKKLKAFVDPEKCFGCGVCVVGCSADAIAMKQVRPWQ
ncbi:ATP-binding protein [Chloroflexota bacterium]